MRAIVIAALAASLATPTLAQVNVTDIGPNGDRDFWCAAAFGMLSYALGQSGDQAGADAAGENMKVLFGDISQTMHDKGMKKEDFDGLVSSYTAATMNPFTEAKYSQDVCEGAVTEAKTAAAEAPPAETTPAPEAAPVPQAKPQ